jgi:hypothetical protein
MRRVPGRTLVTGIFFKEFVKLRTGWLVLLVLSAAFLAWVGLETRQLFRLDHPEVVWYRVIALGQVHYAPLRFVPLITGLVFACMQFLPEMRDERLRLALHLPVDSNVVILGHLAAGAAGLGLLLGCEAAFVAGLTLHYFPAEVARTALLTILPWLLAGLVGYLGQAIVLLEPGLKRRVFYMLLTAGLVAPLFEHVSPGGYARALPWFFAVPPLLALGALLPAGRFRHRRTDA